jgi:hypothetical protein
MITMQRPRTNPRHFSSGRLTQNGLFAKAVEQYRAGNPADVGEGLREAIRRGWSLKGFFNLLDYKVVHDGKRNVYRFVLKLSDRQDLSSDHIRTELAHNRLIPSEVKKQVWKRDGERCVLCSEGKNLHFDHDLPFSKGGTSLNASNVRLLCIKHNLAKSAKIE